MRGTDRGDTGPCRFSFRRRHGAKQRGGRTDPAEIGHRFADRIVALAGTVEIVDRAWLRVGPACGSEDGGDTVVAPAYGYESANARHDKTSFPVDSEFYMTFLGPLSFIKEDGTPIVVVTWDEAQRAYAG